MDDRGQHWGRFGRQKAGQATGQFLGGTGGHWTETNQERRGGDASVQAPPNRTITGVLIAGARTHEIKNRGENRGSKDDRQTQLRNGSGTRRPKRGKWLESQFHKAMRMGQKTQERKHHRHASVTHLNDGSRSFEMFPRADDSTASAHSPAGPAVLRPEPEPCGVDFWLVCCGTGVAGGSANERPSPPGPLLGASEGPEAHCAPAGWAGVIGAARPGIW